MRIIVALSGLLFSSAALATAWEDNFEPWPGNPCPGASSAKVQPEAIRSNGDIDRELDAMWQRGYAPCGTSIFFSDNSKTSDAVRLGKKLGARFVLFDTELVSSRTANVPLTLPSSDTSTTTGTMTSFGSGGLRNRNFTATTTTEGTTTTNIPITVNRYQKGAVYFVEVPKKGSGALTRNLPPELVAKYETMRAIQVTSVRQGSPAYLADILPGDVILKVNGQPSDLATFRAAVASGEPLRLDVRRRGEPREITLTIPPEWR